MTGCTAGSVEGLGGGGGGGGGGDASPASAVDAEPSGPDAGPPDYALSLSTTPTELGLGESAEITVTLTSARFAGAVVLSAAGAPPSWTVTFEPSNTANLIYDGTAEVTMRIQVPTNGEAADTALEISANAAPGLRTGSAPVNVANSLTVTIEGGTDAGAHAFPSSLPVRVGTEITFLNSDGTIHRIHSNGEDAGFEHQEGFMSQGETYSFTFTAGGEYAYYCHIHDPPSGVGSFLVSAP